MSKIITIIFGAGPDAVPEAEGWIIVNYSAPEGGRTQIGAVIRRNGDGTMPTWAEVVVQLVGNLGRQEWPKEIQGKSSGNAMRLSVPDVMDKIVFSADFNPALDQSAQQIANPDFVRIEEETF